MVDTNEMREWRTRHSRNQLPNKKGKGPLEPENMEEEDKLESFFYHLYEFRNPVTIAPAIVPAVLPARYVIDFVPASVAQPDPNPVISNSAFTAPAPVVVSSPIVTSAPTTSPVLSPVFVPAELPPRYATNFVPAASSVVDDFSIVSSTNFIPASMFTSTPCIDTTQ